MSTSFEVDAQLRQDAGKGASRRLRRQGLVPAIVYGAGREPQMISLVHNALIRHLEDETFYSRVLTLKVADNSEQVVIKDLQRHPARPFILHMDFQRISATDKIRMMIPLRFLNEDNATGVKLGGIISHELTEIEVICLPKDLPQYIEIDMLDMDIGDLVHLSQVQLPAGVTLAHAPDPDVPVAVVHGAQIEDEDEDEDVEETEVGDEEEKDDEAADADAETKDES